MGRPLIFDSNIHAVPLGVATPLPTDLFRLRRWQPNPALKPYVRWFWRVEWDLDRHGLFEATTLPHPAASLVLEETRLTLHGPTTQVFRRSLSGIGAATGALFCSAGLAALTTTPVGDFVDTRRPVQEVLNFTSAEVENLTDSQSQPSRIIDLFEQALETRCPDVTDSRVPTVNMIVDSIASNHQLTTVDEVASRHNLSRRTLQRLFTNYVGVGVKTVIRRYRLQEVANLTTKTDDIDWPAQAARLSYSDQAHLIRDFDAVFGTSPAKYQKQMFHERTASTF